MHCRCQFITNDFADNNTTASFLHHRHAIPEPTLRVQPSHTIPEPTPIMIFFLHSSNHHHSGPSMTSLKNGGDAVTMLEWNRFPSTGFPVFSSSMCQQ